MKSLGFQSDADEIFDQEFRDFIESISLNAEEFAEFLAMPESSVPGVRRLVARRQSRVAGS